MIGRPVVIYSMARLILICAIVGVQICAVFLQSEVVSNVEDSSQLNSIQKSTAKSRTLFDYQTRVVAYKDLIESRCLLGFIKAGESFVGNFSDKSKTENLTKSFLMAKNPLSKGQILTIGGSRIVDFCRGFPTFLIQELSTGENSIVPEFEAEDVATRTKRSTSHFFVGRVRGQTQSQYLNFGNSKDPGKAEAESSYGSSKAVVSGSSGMGQAQSQSIPVGCDECYGQDQTLQYGRPGEPLEFPGAQYQKPGRPGYPAAPGERPLQPQAPGFPGYPVTRPGEAPAGSQGPAQPGYPGYPRERPGEKPIGPQGPTQPGYPGYPEARPGEIPAVPQGPAQPEYPGFPGERPGGRPTEPQGPTQPGYPSFPGARPGEPPQPEYPGGRPSERPTQPFYPGFPGERPGMGPSRPLAPGYPGERPGVAPTQPPVPGYPAERPGVGPSGPPGPGYPGERPGVGPTRPLVPGYPGQERPGVRPTGPLVPGYPDERPGVGPIRPLVPGYPGERPGVGPSGPLVPGYPGERPGVAPTGPQLPGYPRYPGERPGERPTQPRYPGGDQRPGFPVYPGERPGEKPTGPPKPGEPSYPSHVPGYPPGPEGITQYPGYPTQPRQPGFPTQPVGPGYPGQPTYPIPPGYPTRPVGPPEGWPSSQKLPGGKFSGQLSGSYFQHTGAEGKFSGIFSGEYEAYQNGKISGRIPEKIVYPGQVPGTQQIFEGRPAYPGVVSHQRPGGYPGGIQPQPGEAGVSALPGYPGEPGQQPAYPIVDGQQQRYPGPSGQQPGYPTGPGQQPSYPLIDGQQPRYPETPGQQPSYPGVSGQQLGYPGGPGYPGIQFGYPEPQPSYPGARPGLPLGQPGIPGLQPGYPGARPGYPGGQPSYPGARPGYPGAQPGYPPGAQPGYTVTQPGYPAVPGVQAGYPGGPVGPEGQLLGYPAPLASDAQPGLPGAPGAQPGYPAVPGQQPTYPGVPGRQPTYPGKIPGVVSPGYPGGPPYSGTPGGVSGYPGGYVDEYGRPGEGPLSYTEGEQVDDSDSQVLTSVQQLNNETQASASAQGKFQGGTAQSQVSGTYSGSGSFSASAGSDDGKRGALTQVSGGKEGAQSSAQGRGGLGQSQAQVQLASETGDTISSAQTGGWNHGSQTQVQASGKGGMADAQANGPGSTSSQAQIGFTPYDENEKDNQTTPFRGGGTAGAQSGTYSGQAQSQIQGKFQYGIRYTGAAQAGSGTGRNQSKPFGFTGSFPEFKPLNFTPGGTPFNTQSQVLHTNDRSTVRKTITRDSPRPRAQEVDQTTLHDLEMEETATEEYHDDDYDDYESDYTTPQPRTKSIITQTSRNQKQHIVLDPLEDLDATVQQSYGYPPDGTILQPGEHIPGSPGYQIPPGFRGRVKSVANGKNTYSTGKNSQAQSVTLTPGTGRIIYKKPIYAVSSNTHFRNGHIGFGSGYTYQPAGHQVKSGKSLPNFVSLTKSETGSKNPYTGKKTPSVYYTQSSSCGVFTNTCVFNGSGKLCFPKPKTNPDGSFVSC